VPDIGVVVIGRNEGQRLVGALCSAKAGGAPVVYVDSGSSDGSVELAGSHGVKVWQLDQTSPFSAARGRAEGVPALLCANQGVKYIQFLDGDCSLDSGWLACASSHLDSTESTGVVCGQLSEAPSELSLYSRISPQSWLQPPGELKSCGGIFMIRREVYEAVGGFNPALLTREESDLCARVRSSGYQVVRLSAQMAQHDSGIRTFRQWWGRAVWGGYGDGLSIRSSPSNRRRLQKHWAGVLIAPVLIVSGAIGMIWSLWGDIALALGLFLIALSLARTALARVRQGHSILRAVEFSVFASLRRVAGAIGLISYYLKRDHAAGRPDPRGPRAGVGDASPERGSASDASS
jgi:GT2 family glycosyltransferase